MVWTSSSDFGQFKVSNNDVTEILKLAGINNTNSYTRTKGGKDGVVLTNKKSLVKITSNNLTRPGSINNELKFMTTASKLNIAPKLHFGKILTFKNKRYLVMKSEKMNGDIRSISLTKNNFQKIKSLVNNLHNRAEITHNNLHHGQVVYKNNPNGSRNFRLINFGRSKSWNMNPGSLYKDLNGLTKIQRSISKEMSPTSPLRGLNSLKRKSAFGSSETPPPRGRLFF